MTPATVAALTFWGAGVAMFGLVALGIRSARRRQTKELRQHQEHQKAEDQDGCG